MGIARKLKKKVHARRADLTLPLPARGKPRGNGRLAIAIGASVGVMIVLTALTIRLIKDPAVPQKLFKPTDQSTVERQSIGQVCSVSAEPPKKAAEGPPPVTFYSELTVQEEPPQAERDPRSGEAGQTDTSLEPKLEGAKQDQRGRANRQDPRLKKNVSAREDAAPVQPGAVSDLPGGKSQGRIYAVQVGAFTHPAVAQQWAEAWRARGYNVLLKPVARPNTGVIYRLYLGNFPSEKKADELVKRLKAKEGINAFRVALRS
jgi:cell division septation protein DedD